MNSASSAALKQQLCCSTTPRRFIIAIVQWDNFCIAGTLAHRQTLGLPRHAARIQLLKLSRFLVATVLRFLCSAMPFCACSQTVIPSMGLEAAFTTLLLPFTWIRLLFSLDSHRHTAHQPNASNRNESTFVADGSKCTRFKSRCFLFVFSWFALKLFSNEQHKVIPNKTKTKTQFVAHLVQIKFRQRDEKQRNKALSS